MSDFDVTDRTRIKREPERGVYDRAAVYAILDEAPVCHVGFPGEGGPVVIPTIHARWDDELLLHGSAASRMLLALRMGVEVCVTVTIVDGLVLARSAFNHSMNYRSVMIFGTATEITDGEAKLEAMRILTERLIPGRWDDLRPPTDSEVRQTRMLTIPLEEVSAKVRTGGPQDEDEDYALATWAGVIATTTKYGAPEADERLAPDIPLPSYLEDFGG